MIVIHDVESAEGVYYLSLEELQIDLGEWLKFYNTDQPHQGKVCNGRTPFATLLDRK
uniref:hypothetical protein n=1 Tax=Acinetobacter wuhouensis TaxID=1879050 RepID=UPI0026C53FD1